jgi:hypothetical protein
MPKRKVAVVVEEVDDADGAVPPRGASKAAAGMAVGGSGNAPTGGPGGADAGGGGAALSKQERKRLKKQRQKEEKRRQAEGGESHEHAAAAVATSKATSAAAGDGDIDDIFGASKQSGSGEQDDVGTIPIFAEGDGDEYVSDGEGGIVARDMDDLEQIFAERRAKAAKARANAAAAATAAAQERDSYVTGKGGKNRRLIDGLAVYTEEEAQKTALADVKGNLDGPCPFDCSCCF